MTTENPYAAPVTDPTVASPVDAPLHLATLGQRFGGALIDALINMAIIFPLSFAMGFYSTRAGHKLSLMETTGMGLAGFAIFLAIHWVFLNATGQTIGKKVAKTRIVTMDGRKPGMGDLAGKRYAFMNLIGIIPLAGSILSLVNILFIFRNDRRCLHDLIAGTQVVQVTPGQPIV
ncbi:MAG TPA: RDD family protein [Luteolibacter sp.]